MAGDDSGARNRVPRRAWGNMKERSVTRHANVRPRADSVDKAAAFVAAVDSCARQGRRTWSPTRSPAFDGTIRAASEGRLAMNKPARAMAAILVFVVGLVAIGAVVYYVAFVPERSPQVSR